MFEIMEAQSQDAVIKVIGVGGCGGNAVDHMIEQGVLGVEFIVINTDAQALKRSKARTQLQIGANITKGLGAGAKPSVGQAAAEEDRERIKEMIMGANMVFITAGMGGGTGTGAAPIVAQIAKELDILTVAVVTKPFTYEGNRMRYAKAGIEALSEYVDSLIIVPNAKLMEVLGSDITVPEAFKAANGVLQGAVAGIAEVINVPGLINVDFADVRTVMSENGMAMMGSAIASGPDRARVAAERAIASPLLEDVDMSGARGVLVNITSSSALKMKEIDDVMECVQFAAEEATVIVGIPPLLLQPLLENAVYHGIEPLSQGGRITIRISSSVKELQLVVENPCTPATGERHSGSKMALQNIRERLELLFDVEARYQVESTEETYRVEITLPGVTEEIL